MPVGRIILKSISDSKKISNLKTDGARLLYTWLLTHLDINGCYSGDPQVINGKVFTRLNKSNKTIEGYLEDMEANKLIIRYKTDGDIFLNVPNFVEKQPSLRPDREGKSNLPLPPPALLQHYSSSTPAQVKISKDKISISKDKDKKRSFAEYVTLTLKEYRKLKKDYGKDGVKKIIQKLDNSKASKGYKYKSDYRAILNWVVEAVIKKKPKSDWRRT